VIDIFGILPRGSPKAILYAAKALIDLGLHGEDGVHLHKGSPKAINASILLGLTGRMSDSR
jgi:hypothetical protein